MRQQFVSRSEAETERLGAELASAIAADAVILLEGDLGSGKTVLVKGVARALGIERREVQSPTYTLIHEHEGACGRLIHIDLYRLEGEEIGALGLDEVLMGAGVKAVEWAERLSEAGVAVPGAVRVKFQKAAGGGRRILIQAPAARQLDTIGGGRRSQEESQG